MNTQQESKQFTGTVQVGRREDLAEFARLYKAAYPHSTPGNLRRDVKPEEVHHWAAYKTPEGEILMAMHTRSDGVVWLLADPSNDSLELVHAFLMLLRTAWASLAPYGMRGIEIIYAPSLEPLAQRLEQAGLIGKRMASIRTSLFDEGILNPARAS